MDWQVIEWQGNPNHWDVEVTLKRLDTGEIKTHFFDRANWEFGPGEILDLDADCEPMEILLSPEDAQELWEQEQLLYVTLEEP